LLWDRVKFLLLFGGAWFVLTYSSVAGADPRLPRGVALSQALYSTRWLALLFVLELMRQAHYLIEEHWAAYYSWWKNLGKRGDKARESLNPYTRYRLGRLAWVAALLFLFGAILAYYFDDVDTPWQGIIVAPAFVLSRIPSILQYAFIIALGILQFVAIFYFLSKGGVQTYMPDDLDTRFSDVKGQDAVLERVQENMVFLEDPESIESRGGFVPGGILLWGPPGTGKTLMAQAVAGETAKPFVFVEPGAFINMFMGVGILKVKALYRRLRKLATRYGGVIVFFDEADSLGNRGIGGQPGGWNAGAAPGSPWSTMPACNGFSYLSEPGRHALYLGAQPTPVEPGKDRVVFGGFGGGGMGTLQSLLSEMDGLKKPRGFLNRVVRRALGMRQKPPPKYRILHIFATNRPDVLDEAMLRPGRIDRIYKVGYPHKQGRLETFKLYFDKVTHELTEEQLDQLATITPYASGAMIKDMVNEALVIAIRDGRETINFQDVITAKQLKQHGVPDDWVYVERERHAVAIHEASHAVTAALLRRHSTIDIATIERRGDIGGFVSWIPLEDLFTTWRSQDETDVMTSLASLAGERMFFEGDSSRGVSGDMQSATRLSLMMEGMFAMGDTIASRMVTLGSFRGAQPIEDGADRQLMDGPFGRRVEARLETLYERTWTLLDENRLHVLAVAHALEVHRTITGDDVRAIVEGSEGPIVDGRVYHDPVFRQQLLDYHEAALAAHLAQSDVLVSVPTPAPVAGALIPQPNGQESETTAQPESPPRPDGA
jgi:ATP-dependent Zn protease